jgi:hypothetical protein
MVAAALIDRLVHHATMISLKGKSYRLRERGLDVTPAAQAPSLRDSACRRLLPQVDRVVHFSTAQTGALFGCA